MKIRIYTTDKKNWFVQDLESGYHLHYEKSRKKGKERCEKWLSENRKSIF